MTFVGTQFPDEVYIHYNDNFDQIYAYAYKDSPLINFKSDDWEVSNPEQLSDWNWNWKKGSNPLFYHISGNVNSFIWWITQLGYVEEELT